MSCPPPRRTIIVTILALLPALLLADAPPSNTIPVIADRPNFDDVDLELFCLLSWHHFDVLQAGDESAQNVYDKFVTPADSTGMFLSISPSPIQRWGHWPWSWVGRISEYSIHGDSAYARPVWPWVSFGDSVFLSQDSLLAAFSASAFEDSLEYSAYVMDSLFGDVSSVWFYNTFDEAPSRQWNRMVYDSIFVDTLTQDTTYYYFYDDFIPNMFTQDRDSIYRAAFDSTMYLPTLDLVDPMGTFSWLKREVELADSNHTVVCVFGILHTIEDWALADNLTPYTPGTFSDQAASVRSYLNMGYLPYSDPLPVDTVDNLPELLMVDAYPFRQVGIEYQVDESYSPSLGDSLNTWLLEHFEEGLDSTFIPAREVALDQERDIPVIYWSQAFGRIGGSQMWAQDSTLAYPSYPYRIPTSAEVLMNFNIALLRGAKGLLPYCMRTYEETNSVNAGYFDTNNIPFDAPYEEWVYRDRHRSDYDVIPPDSFPPFIDSPYDFDPLYDLPDRPINVPGSERNQESYLLWKFKPYARVWNGMRASLGQVGTIAPELSSLWWWEDYEDVAEISAPDSGSYDPFVQPEIRVFKLDGSNHVYLFYVNRQCRQDSTRVHIVIDDRDIPSSLITQYGLDHSRRFIIPVDNIRHEFYFDDTLEAGQGRLVEFVNALTLDPDIRVTDPDVVAFYAGTSKKTRDFEFIAGDDIDIQVEFYNMSTDSLEDVIVTCTDLTDDTEIDRDTLDFEGLSTSGWVSDFETGRFTWETDSTDVGVHILEMRSIPVSGEPDTLDNVARATFLIRPRDYATFVLDDPWDMTEDKVRPPDWHTSDIDTLIGWNMDSTLTDSISGMFEGVVPNPDNTNRLYLNVREIKPIEPDRFSVLSLAGIALERSLSVYLGWRDKDDSVYVVDTGLDLTTDWLESDPVSLGSLSSDWDTLDVEDIWLEFGGSNLPTSIRLGWVKLTE